MCQYILMQELAILLWKGLESKYFGVGGLHFLRRNSQLPCGSTEAEMLYKPLVRAAFLQNLTHVDLYLIS